MNGKQNAVDVLTGSNKDEANFGICGPAPASPAAAAQAHDGRRVQDRAQRKFGELADQYLQALSRRVGCRRAAGGARSVRATRSTGTCASGRRRRRSKGKKAYTYFFTHIQTVNGQPSPQGATHTAEISFAWNNPKGQANADVERRRHQARRPDVVLLGELHHQGRSERQRPAAVAANSRTWRRAR